MFIDRLQCTLHNQQEKSICHHAFKNFTVDFLYKKNTKTRLPGNFFGCYGYIAGHDTSLESLGHEVHHDILVAKVTHWLLREFTKNALPSVAMDILPNMIAHWKA